MIESTKVNMSHSNLSLIDGISVEVFQMRILDNAKDIKNMILIQSYK